MNNIQKVTSQLDAICTDLNAYNDILFSQDFSQLKGYIKNLKDALKEEEEKNRLLRIGIVGSVKAGKSTFLNALLFGGEPVLPRAATPMTASLTRLCYAEKPYAKLYFYSQEDWNTIKAEAEEANRLIDKELKEYVVSLRSSENIDIDAEREYIKSSKKLSDLQKSCLELVETAEQSRIDIADYLGREESIDIKDKSEAQTKLEEYIGSKGRLTPVVKYVVLGLNDERIRDLEIIDTPGLNDPVRSRSQETYNFMLCCDAVFVLSRASQFMTEDDKRLVKRTLNGCGIQQHIIIATQMDISAQNELKESSFKKAFGRAGKHVIDEGKKIKREVVPVSALMYAYAYKIENGLNLDKDEYELQKNLQSHFKQDIPSTFRDYKAYSNMGPIENKLVFYRKSKNSIILEHQESRIKAAKKEIVAILSRLYTGLDTGRRLLKEEDIESLNKKYQQISNAIQSVHCQVSDFFRDMENKVATELADLRQRVTANAKQFDSLTVTTKVEKIDRSSENGFWLWKKIKTWVDTITTHTANLDEGLRLLRNFSAKVEGDINDTFIGLLDKESLSKEISRIILPKVRLIDISFNEDIIRIPVKTVVNTITVPKFKFDNKPYNDALVEQFPDGIVNEKVSDFLVAFEQQLQQLIKDIREKLEEQEKNISYILAKQSSEFSHDIQRNLNEQIEKISQLMKDKESNLLRYDKAMSILRQYSSDMFGADV